MLKLAGAALVILACGLVGIIMAQNYVERPRQLKSILAALQMLETHILYAASPLPEAFYMIGQRCEAKIAPLFKTTSKLLTEQAGYSATEAWHKALGESFNQTSFSISDLQILKNFGETLGISDRHDQEKHIKLAVEQIKMEISKAEEAALKSTRMWRYMGFMGGLLLVIVIY